MASVDIVIPVLNEEHSLARCVNLLIKFLGIHLAHHKFRILIADNGSMDRTGDVAARLVSDNAGLVVYLRLGQRGRGRALKKAWIESSADIVSYMDVDLSTELNAFPDLIDAIARDGFHIVTGTRLANAATTSRSFKRELISRAYNILIKVTFRTTFTDAQCGFKALRGDVASAIIPSVLNNNWFFDTEMLIIAEKNGFRMKEIPVTWTEDRDTRVHLFGTIMEDLNGLARLRFKGVPSIHFP
jgi:glycosyltransferase involved in cell wall biosynthesis